LEVTEFKRCIIKDQNCDLIRRNIYITTAAVVPLLAAAITSTAVYMLKGKKKIPVLSAPGEISREIEPEEEERAEGEEAYYSASEEEEVESEEEGYESAEEVSEDDIKRAEDAYEHQYLLLNSALQQKAGIARGKSAMYKKSDEPPMIFKLQPAKGTIVKEAKEIQQRLEEAKKIKKEADSATDPVKKLELLKKALKVLTTRR
jgi:hypothetical protein